MVKNIKQRLKATFCVLAMAILLIPITGKALSKTEIESQREAIEEQQNDLEEALAELVGKQEEVEAYSVLLNQKITITEDSIDLAIESISQINSDILSLEKDLLSSQQKYETALENLKVRLVSLYETGEISSLEILLSSSSLYDFSLKTEALQLIAEHDVELMEEIQQYISETETLRTQLASQKELVAENKLLLERDQADLELLMKENNEVLKEILANQGDLDQQLSELATDDQELLEQYEALIEEEKRKEEEEANKKEEEENNNSSSGGSSNSGSSAGSSSSGGSSSSSDFSPIWPVPGWGTNYITCVFGNGHNGLDIAASYGTPIVASNDGKVLSAEYHWSWGNNVLVYHNSTYTTRYAHMSKMAVTAGEYVTAGQIIGYVGNTGHSFGNHLHFEIYKNGVRVDPYPYLI